MGEGRGRMREGGWEKGLQTTVEAALFFGCQHNIKQVTTNNAFNVCYIFSNFDG